MKLKLTILLLLACIGVMAQAPYPIPSTNIVMGQNTSSTVLIKGSVKINGISTGSTDSLVTIFNGVLRKVPQSQLMSVYTAGYGLLTTGNQFRVDTSILVNKTYITALNATLPHLATNNTYTGNQQISGAANIYITGNYGFSAPVQYTTLIAPERIRIGGMQDVFDIAPSSIKLTNGPSGNITLLHNNISATRTVNWPNRDGVLVVGGDLTDGLATKQNTLVYDALPANGSTNSVNSNGIFQAIQTSASAQSATYIQNQSATPQTATFNISGLAKAGSSSITGNSDVGGSQTVAATSTLQNVVVNNRIGVGGSPNTGIEYISATNGIDGIRVSRTTVPTQYIQIDVGTGSDHRLNSTGSGKGLIIRNNNTGVALGNTTDGITFQVPSATTNTTTPALTISSGNSPVVAIINKGTQANAPTAANDLFRLTDAKSNKLNTAASATITTAQLLANNGTFYIYVDASGGARTITLLSVAAHLGKTVIIQKTDSSANTVTVSGGAVNINQATTYPLTTQNASVAIAEDGTQFRAR